MGDDVLTRTERLVLRPWRHQEAPRLLDIHSREEVVRRLDDGPTVLMASLEEAHARIERYQARLAAPPSGVWAIEVRETGIVAGSVVLAPMELGANGEWEIGWHLHPDCWGHGYAGEAATAVLAYGLSKGLREIWALPSLDNYPSQAVARRAGMEEVGRVDRWYPEPSHAFRVVARPG